ncbi:MAG: hypothetical protein E7533_02550 [Ruminococcaceae bacterium]|nr:hypothetical protein [Oscillospiraceae bacterium]
MKKTIRVLVCAVLLVSLAISANAEYFNGADLFSVELPDGFEQTGTATAEFSFYSENGDNFAVSYVENADVKEPFCPGNLNEKDIEEYKKALIKENEDILGKFTESFEMKALSCERLKHPDDTSAIVTVLKIKVEMNGEELVYFNKVYEFGGVDYKYTFTFSTQDEKRKDSFDEAFNSIDIFEPYIRSVGEDIAVYSVAGFIGLLIVAGIIRFIRTPDKKQRKK